MTARKPQDGELDALKTAYAALESQPEEAWPRMMRWIQDRLKGRYLEARKAEERDPTSALISASTPEEEVRALRTLADRVQSLRDMLPKDSPLHASTFSLLALIGDLSALAGARRGDASELNAKFANHRADEAGEASVAAGR